MILPNLNGNYLRSYWTKLCLLGWWLVAGQVIYGQAFRSQVYNIQEGLAQSQVTSMCQDSRGYVWMGTRSGGASRFDGRSFKTFTTDQGLLSNAVAVIAEDPKGNLWFACNNQGLCWYDGYKFHVPTVGKQPSFEAAKDIYFSPAGEVWLATAGDGLIIIAGDSIEQFKRKDGLSNDSVLAIIPINKDEVWLGTNKGITVVRGREFSALDRSRYPTAPTGPVHAMTRLANTVLIGSQGEQLWRLDGTRFTYDTLPESIAEIRAILQDRSGNLWFAGGNLAAHMTTAKGFRRFDSDEGLKEATSDCLLEDKNGNVWIGTNGGGAIRFSPGAFTMYGPSTPLADRGIFGVVEMAPDHLLVCTERGLFQLRNGIVSQVIGLPNPEADIFSMAREPSGSILVACLNDGLYRYDRSTFTKIQDPQGDLCLFNTQIIIDPDGAALIPGKTGLFKIVGNQIERVELPGIVFDGDPFLAHVDRKRQVWLSFDRQGLLRWDNGVVKRFGATEGFDQSIFEFDEDPYGAIWVSTGAGMYRFKGDASCYLTTREGLSGNVVYLSQNDGKNNLWAGTENGLTRIALDRNSDPIAIQTYGKADGFTGIECNQGASVRDSKGDLWFGTIEGLTCYHPAADIEDSLPPVVEITDFQVNLEVVDWERRGIATAPWTGVPINAVLRSSEDHVRIEFSGITQHLGEKVKYRYMLEGLDKDYSAPTSENFRIFSPLPSGEYTFKVIACNANGVWTKVPATLHFTIPTPFWRTIWFALLVFVLILVALGATVRIRTHNLQRQRALLEVKVGQRTEALEQANQVKGEFLAKMSHEIRTPMNGVIGMTDLLGRTALTPQQRKFVDNIRVSGQNLLDLINDILDFSRIESGKFELENIAFDLRHTMEEVMDILSFSAFSKGLEMLYWVDPEIRGPVTGDPARIKQVLTNLVGNAIKFTAQGEITLRARLLKLEDGRATIQCSIRDSGIGIPKEKHTTLFESFTQVDASTTRKYGGTGLGLAISYNLARLMGGEMWVESDSGHGAEFFFTIKVGTSGPWNYLGDAHPAKSLEGSKVVLAMQHPGTKVLLGEYLNHWGVHMQSFDTIEEASDAALDQEGIAFLLIDLRLSHGDPAQFVKRIAALCADRGMRFGLLAEPDVSLWMQNLVGDHGWVLPKPLKRDDLLHALTGQRYDQEAQATSESLASLATQVPLRILVAEDNPINQDVAIGMLSSLGYNPLVAHNGQEAVDEALQGGIDLIFMDVQMPVMDGIEATKQIVARMPKDKRPLIVAMTANAMESDRQRCLEAGMDTFISKPFLMNELVRALRNLDELRRGERTTTVATPVVESPQVEPQPQEVPVSPADAQPKYRLTDMGMLEAVSNGEPAFILGILSKLVAKLPEAVQELRDAAAKADWETVRATAHRNKSSAAYSGSDALKEKFKALEQMARERDQLEHMPERLDELDAFVQAVIAELQQHIAERGG